ncbi:MAG TPA: VOC family protein [Usitatibacter sp.]|nr:VOC family protein [Usitatibacter sp.]
MKPQRPELGATLDHACLQSAQPAELAAFLARCYAMQCRQVADEWHCTGPGRRLVVRQGPANHAAYIAYAFDDAERLAAHRARMLGRSLATMANPSRLFDASAHACADPDGNVVAFGVRSAPACDAEEPLPARLQHLALRTPRLDAMADFYEALGFVVSDRVKDGEGMLRACFLRSDCEHHSLALFGAAEARFDHLSCETRDIGAVVAWADRMAGHRIAIHWGIGRHGPGNDVFFMVKDPDGNLLEISADLEVCDAGRAAGTWPHEQRTLNLWGNAIMRS